MTRYTQATLDSFIAEVDRLGGLGHPQVQPLIRDFTYEPTLSVDQSPDPFSEKYFQAQVALYQELSGRSVNQEEGEQTILNVEKHAAGVNPYADPNVKLISKHMRAIATCMAMADLPPNAAVLDAGCGWGVSSEIMAFCGARVTALDINPRFVELVSKRSARLGLPISPVCSNFDTFTAEPEYDMLFFYECLHHSLKPWETVQRLGRFVKPGGKILFAGEPVNNIWWHHWGMRLDAQSVYCIRKFGWWESGWSAQFIIDCFARAGFTLKLFPHIGLDNGLVGVAVHTAEAATTRIDTTVYDPISNLTDQLTTFQRYSAKIQQQLGDIRRSWTMRLTSPLRLGRRLLQKIAS
ncbi:MAG: methyltransferase domain-containing protein [Gemmataceae bacterium]